MRRMSLAACLLVVAGCTPEPERAVDPPPVSPPAEEPAFVALEGEGLRLIVASTGSARPLAFGTPQSQIVTALTTVFGTDPVEQGEAADCGADYARWIEGLTVWFTRGRFAGWAIADQSPLTTIDGWGTGSTRATVEASRQVAVMPSSLGTEFTVGAIAGLLESDTPDARILHLWAGHTCIAR